MESLPSDKKTIGERFGDKNPIHSKKFIGVSKTVDTGKTIKDVQILSDQYVSKRKSELFKRIKSSTVVKLIDENNNSESIYNLAEENNVEESVNSTIKENQSVYSYKTDASVKTTVTAITFATEMLGNLPQLSYLILDVREECEYNDYHIKEAVSFPAPNISRDKFPIEMIRLKNKPDKLIIIYGSDERSGVSSAGLLVQKGYDNLFLITGGIEEFVKEYPEKCDGPKVQQLVNEKLQQEILKKDALLKTNKNKFVKDGTFTADTYKQNTCTKSSMISGVSSNKSTSNNVKFLKKNLQK